MLEVRQTAAYSARFDKLRDRAAKVRNVKPVGEGVSALRVNCGPGYRIYYVQRGEELVVLLAGGDKSTQEQDIREAKDLAREL